MTLAKNAAILSLYEWILDQSQREAWFKNACQGARRVTTGCIFMVESFSTSLHATQGPAASSTEHETHAFYRVLACFSRTSLNLIEIPAIFGL